jgi:hypothetical protein
MTRGPRLVALALLAWLAGCSAPRTDSANAPPELPQASAVLRTAAIRIADPVEIDIRVTTAPGRRVLRPELPADLAGFEILDWQLLPVVREPGLWIHDQAVRLRAREVGRFEWPALRIPVLKADGTRTALELGAIALDVRSILREHPHRTAPFGARTAPDPQQDSPAHGMMLAAAAAGTALALAAAAALVRVRRRRRTTPAPTEAPPAPWNEALAELDRAAANEPTPACHRAAAVLRSYMDRRFGARSRTHTTEELATTVPPYGATSRWPTFVALLQDFDDLRFRPDPRDSGDLAHGAVDAALTRARAFVTATTPPEGLR